MGSALTNSVCPNVPLQTAKHDRRHQAFLIRVTSTEEKERAVTLREKRETEGRGDTGRDADCRALREHSGDDKR